MEGSGLCSASPAAHFQTQEVECLCHRESGKQSLQLSPTVPELLCLKLKICQIVAVCEDAQTVCSCLEMATHSAQDPWKLAYSKPSPNF